MIHPTTKLNRFIVALNNNTPLIVSNRLNLPHNIQHFMYVVISVVLFPFLVPPPSPPLPFFFFGIGIDGVGGVGVDGLDVGNEGTGGNGAGCPGGAVVVWDESAVYSTAGGTGVAVESIVSDACVEDCGMFDGAEWFIVKVRVKEGMHTREERRNA